ncbi:MAG TPA: FtsX-like permease family protein, partial [Puia sp.]|nr:FtsX-like permease family protein [Puia sp.]
IYLPQDSVSLNAVHSFQDALRRRPEVQGLTVGDGMTLGGSLLGSAVAETTGKKRELMCYYYSIDENFLPVFQIHLLMGRNLSEKFATDKKEAFLVNEAFVKAMGWKTAIGKTMDGYGHQGHVVGVVKNFYFNSLHNLVGPTILVYNTHGANTATLRIRPSDLPNVKALFKTYFPTLPFDYSFFDDMLNKQYEKDKMTMSLFNAFMILAIFVSCLGLYGLVSLIAGQRTTEIGIRKLLGASLNQLFSVLATDFIKLVFVAIAIALPVGGIVMSRWLASYAYHIPVNWWMFLIPVLFTLLIALMVISREIIKTAIANPVKSLRME